MEASTAIKHEWFNVAPLKPAIRIERLRYFQSRRRWSAKISSIGRSMRARTLEEILTAKDGSSSYITPDAHKLKLAGRRLSDSSDDDAYHYRNSDATQVTSPSGSEQNDSDAGILPDYFILLQKY